MPFAMPWNNVVRQLEVTANDSDKTIAVPANTEWEMLGIEVKLATTGTSGNRQLEVRFRDAADATIFSLFVGAVQAASATVFYSFAPGFPRETTVVATSLLHPLPQGLTLGSAWDIRILDNAAVDAAADELELSLIYKEVARGTAV